MFLTVLTPITLLLKMKTKTTLFINCHQYYSFTTPPPPPPLVYNLLGHLLTYNTITSYSIVHLDYTF